MNLITLKKAKEYLSIDPSDITYDSFLRSQIEIISDAISGYCRREFLSNEYVQTFYQDEMLESGFPVTDILLFHYPVVSISEILEDAVATTDYRLNKAGGRVLRTSDSSRTYWFMESKEIQITYTAGLTSTPAPVEDVIYSILQERYNKKVSGINLSFGSDVQRIAIPGVMSLDFDYSLQGNERSSRYGTILGNHLNVLDSYRSERAIMGTLKYSYTEEA